MNKLKKYFPSIILFFIAIIYFGVIRGFRFDNIEYFVALNGDINQLVYLPLKMIEETGWSYCTDRLAAPFGAEFYDYPIIFSETISLTFMKLIMYFINDILLTVAIYYILSGFMIIYISYYVLRQIGVSVLFSILGATAYLCLPYYVIRIGHWGLALYQFVPLSILLCYWCYHDENILKLRDGLWKYKRNIIIIISCFCIALAGNGYYTFYSCLIIFFTGILKTELKNVKKIKPFIVIILVIGSIFTMNYLPNKIYQYKNGINNEIVVRTVEQTELYGLKFIQLGLPIFSRNDFVNNKREEYINATLNTEAITANIGWIGVIGTLILLVCFLIKKLDNKLFILSRLNLILILWGIVGGFGTITSLLGFTVFRSNNRVSIFIAFISILATCLIIDKMQLYIKNHKSNILFEKIFTLLIAVLFLLLVRDNLPRGLNSFSYNVNKEQINNDMEFFSSIEYILGKEAMIYQMPYAKFPEEKPPYKMTPEEHLKGYIYTNTLKWSFGGLKGRYPDKWNELVSKLPLDKQLKLLSIVGFNGIYIDRDGYSPEVFKLLNNKLNFYLDKEHIFNKEHDKIVYSMEQYNEIYRDRYNNEELDLLKKKILNIEIKNINDLNFDGRNIGFYSKEIDDRGAFRWINNKAIIKKEKEQWITRISFKAYTNQEQVSNLKIKINDKIIDEYNINNKGTVININIPYEYAGDDIVIETDSPRIKEDSREIYVKLKDEYIEYNNINNIIPLLL